METSPVTCASRQIRSAFIADPGHVLISADYSQIELRVLAHLSGDETLTAAFTRGDDIHDQTAARVFGPDSTLDPYELRRRAKIINYALLYGKTAFTLAKDIGVSQQAAQQFIDAYFAGFPRVRAFIDKTLADAQASGVVKTMFGRRRPVPELTQEARTALRAHRWPGNVRELRNVLERAVVLSPAGTLRLGPLEDARGPTDSSAGVLPFPAPLAEVVRTAAQAMLDLTGGNKSEAARRLGISRPRLQRLLDGNLEE